MPRYAAIDIGSNSVRMEAADVTGDGPPRILASERQVTRLGAGVFRNGRVGVEAIESLCGVLRGMTAVYKRLDVSGVRAVATAAVRDASNQKEFITRASEAIGSQVEIISGQEEARLIHLGVASRWPHPRERFLIIDIGGGSAEIIFSDVERMRQAFSRPVGALRVQEMFLRSDPPRESEIHRMEEYIEERIAPALRKIDSAVIDRVVATSATASAVVCAANRIPRWRREEADRKKASTAQVRRLYREIRSLDLKARQAMTGIGPRRAEIIIPGAAVLLHLLEGLRMQSVYYSAAGVRDGIIADLAARGVGKELSQLSAEERDVVEEMAMRYAVPMRHARKVARISNDLFLGFADVHRLPRHFGKLLEAAAYLHDVGHYVSDTRHHKHSYYLVANSDLPGFTRLEREIIANLCRYHRKAMPSEEHGNVQTMDAESRRAVLLMMPLLRLADALDRSRGQRVRSVECRVRDSEFSVLLNTTPETDIDLELWAAERLNGVFSEVYGQPVMLTRTAN
jgi:exopolyphosphatase/guanosine-5'-triphosphate,3'-diphosphate pyrophosphatase